MITGYHRNSHTGEPAAASIRNGTWSQGTKIFHLKTLTQQAAPRLRTAVAPNGVGSAVSHSVIERGSKISSRGERPHRTLWHSLSGSSFVLITSPTYLYQTSVLTT